MNCKDVLQVTQTFVDGALDADTRARISVHTRGCESCRVALHERQGMAMKISQAVRSRATAPASIASGVRLRLDRAPTRSRGVRSWALGVAGALILISGVAALFLTRPSPAQAVFHQVINAAHDVKSCHIVLWLQEPGGTREKHITWYANGRFRRETWRGRTMVQVYAYDGKTLYIYDARSNVALVSARPFGAPFEGFTMTALLAPDVIGPDADIELDRTRGPDGRRLNRFTVTKARERVVILADQATNLPVAITIYALHKSRWQLVGGTDVLEFDVPLDGHLFAPRLPPGARVVDRDRLIEEWWSRYETGLAGVRVDGEEAVLRDFQVTTGGDVYAIGSLSVPGPVEVRDAHLEDSLGTVYLHVEEGFQAGLDPCAMFVPLRDLPRAPTWYLLTVQIRPERRDGTREHRSVVLRVGSPVFSPSSDPIFPNHKEYAERAQTNIGFLYPSGPASAIIRARTRAEYWKERGDVRQALRCYEEMVEAADSWTHRRYLDAWAGVCTVDPWTWKNVGSLYERAGMSAEAHDAYERGLEAAKDRSYAEFSEPVVKDLLAGVERTR